MDLQQLDIKSDRRGTLVEAFKLPNDGQVFYINAVPFETRGNHYHLRKTEHFLVVFGSAEFQTRDRDSGNTMKVVVGGERPMTVAIHPNHTHSVMATEEGAIILVWCDEQFNPDDPDTYGEEI